MTVMQAEGYPSDLAFWSLVLWSLAELFQTGQDEAHRLVRDYAWRLAEASPSERLLVFHSEALHVAADLCGAPEISDEMVTRYLGLRDELMPAAESVRA